MNSTILSFPWGSENLFVQNKSVTVKILNIKHGEMPSLQYHKHRSEFWRVLKGTPQLVIGNDTRNAKEGDEFEIPVGIQHRIIAKDGDVSILEISSGDFDENDIVRLEDKYGRV